MATTTPNYGWTVPTSTDLVKDGATAIETLGDAIDASMNTALGTKKAGMVLLNTTSFSGVTSASAPANTFSSTYTDYFIKCNLTLSNSTELFFRMRAAGTDATGSNYTYQYIYGVGVALAAATGTLTNGYLGVISASGRMVTETTIFNPNLAVNTFTNSKNTSSALAVATSGVNHTLATAYDSITILPGAGTITGDMAIYGLAK